MQIYEPLNELIEKTKLSIAEEVAQEAHNRKLNSYLKYDRQALAQLFLPTVEMLARYVLKGDPTEYRDYIAQLAEKRLSQGYDMQDFFVMGEVLSTVIKKKVVEHFTAPQEQTYRQIYSRRLDGIQNLAQTTVNGVRARLHL